MLKLVALLSLIALAICGAPLSTKKDSLAAKTVKFVENITDKEFATIMTIVEEYSVHKSIDKVWGALKAKDAALHAKMMVLKDEAEKVIKKLGAEARAFMDKVFSDMEKKYSSGGSEADMTEMMEDALAIAGVLRYAFNFEKFDDFDVDMKLCLGPLVVEYLSDLSQAELDVLYEAMTRRHLEEELQGPYNKLWPTLWKKVVESKDRADNLKGTADSFIYHSMGIFRDLHKRIVDKEAGRSQAKKEVLAILDQYKCLSDEDRKQLDGSFPVAACTLEEIMELEKERAEEDEGSASNHDESDPDEVIR